MIIPGPRHYMWLKDIILAKIGWNATCRHLTHIKIHLKRKILTEACDIVILVFYSANPPSYRAKNMMPDQSTEKMSLKLTSVDLPNFSGHMSKSVFLVRGIHEILDITDPQCDAVPNQMQQSTAPIFQSPTES